MTCFFVDVLLPILETSYLVFFTFMFIKDQDNWTHTAFFVRLLRLKVTLLTVCLYTSLSVNRARGPGAEADTHTFFCTYICGVSGW